MIKMACAIILSSIVLVSCAMSPQVQIFKVGEIEIRIYQDREFMIKELPEKAKFWDGQRIADKVIRILGFYDRDTKTIYSIDNMYCVIHELKHYLEPEWIHPLLDKNTLCKLGLNDQWFSSR